ncbi:MAG: DUF3034 family protein [Pseudomonadota bacterium]
MTGTSGNASGSRDPRSLSTSAPEDDDAAMGNGTTRAARIRCASALFDPDTDIAPGRDGAWVWPSEKLAIRAAIGKKTPWRPEALSDTAGTAAGARAQAWCSIGAWHGTQDHGNAMTRVRHWIGLTVVVLLGASAAQAGNRQPGTGGATQIEGAAGGGLVPWAVIQGYGSSGEIDVTAFGTVLDVDDYRLRSYGVAAGIFNRVELSIARQELDLETLGPALGFPGAELEQDVFSAKVRLGGTLFYPGLPQIVAGAQYKRNRSFELPALAGARDDSDIDFYVSAARLWLAGVGGFNGFANATVRWTRANELGLLGFGGPRNDDRDARFEGAAGVFLSRAWMVGAEYRQKPDNLAFGEDDWWDLFVAWVPNRHVSVVGAWVDLGSVGGLDGQSGFYLSVEGAF